MTKALRLKAFIAMALHKDDAKEKMLEVASVLLKFAD
jgi:hypothetical protein